MMKRTSKYNSDRAEMAACGEYGFMYFDTSGGEEFTPPAGYCFSAIQALGDTTVVKITACRDCTITIPGESFFLPEGNTILLRAEKIILSGTGVLYYGGIE